MVGVDNTAPTMVGRTQERQMSDTDPLAGTTIGPDGKRVPADAEGNPVEAERAIVNEGDALPAVDEEKTPDEEAQTDAAQTSGDETPGATPSEELTDPGDKQTAEDVGYGTVPDAVNTGAPLENPAAEKAEQERAASGSQADEQLASGPEGGPNDAAETGATPGPAAEPSGS
jgi:hypothetical protein